ncbi:MAG: hypothetical protein KBH11_11245 [Bacteroidia bacterium]|nr:hypothetical protein [Bacteroidia bacterium]
MFIIECQRSINQPSIGLNQFSQTDPSLSTESIVVEDFSGAGLFPIAALHVNTNYLNGHNTIPPSYNNFGEVFLTDAPDRQDDGDIYSFWRMFTGAKKLEVGHLAIFKSET